MPKRENDQVSSNDEVPGETGRNDPDATMHEIADKTLAMPGQAARKEPDNKPASDQPDAQSAGEGPGPAGEEPVAVLNNGRYQLVERVGAGSIGQVWRAFDTTLQRVVAIKTVNLATSADPTTEARFRREAVATAGLEHPNVVQIYDSGVDGHTAFLVMEYLRGPNLQGLVNREGPVPFEQAVPLLAQVAAGLGAAHAIGVTHRDVKPANVVLETDSLQATPKLVDFGIARLNDQQATALTSTMTAIGSAAYMSPEQASGERVSPASDIYSFGCLMTTVLTGHPPFPGESPIAVARAQVYDQPTPLRELRSDCPAALEALVTALLAKDPSARPTATQAETALRAIETDPDAPSTVSVPVPPPDTDDQATRVMSPASTAAQTPATPAQQSATGSLVPAELAGSDAEQAGDTGDFPAKPKTSARRNRIIVAVVVLLVLTIAVWLAWSQGRREVHPAQSSTVTMTETHSATASQTSAAAPAITETNTYTSSAPTTATSTAASAGPSTTSAAENTTDENSAESTSIATQEPAMTTSAAPQTSQAPQSQQAASPVDSHQTTSTETHTSPGTMATASQDIAASSGPNA